MANDSNTLMRMRAAQIPPHAYESSAKSLKQSRMTFILEGGKYEENGFNISFLFEANPENRKPKCSVPMACSVFGKELVLRQKNVLWLDLAALVRASKNTEEIPLGVGRGFWVVGDIGENTQHWAKWEWDNAQSLLLSHLARGGALILGDTGAVDHGYYNMDMIDALSVFDEVRVE